ncbi:MAG: methyltransferase [Brevundimonas sp.]
MTHSLARAERAADTALLQVLDWLAERNYAFVTPTGRTHGFVRHRASARRADLLRDIFGWTRPFTADLIDPALLELLRQADVVDEQGGAMKLTIRASTLDGRRYLHSAPTSSPDAVFLGPDSYRYARFLRHALRGSGPIGEALDIGVGAGVGAVTLADLCPGAIVTGSDINAEALRLARINAAHNGAIVNLLECSGLPLTPRQFDVIAANPPYIAGAQKRTYRDGGGVLGADLALEWVRSGLPRLASGGQFLLYTGSAIVRGQDLIRAELERLAAAGGCSLDYEEIDPDVFGGTLRQDAYRDVERIAAIGAILRAP